MSKIILESKVLHDNYTDYVCDKFDLQKKDVSITEIPMIKENELENFKGNLKRVKERLKIFKER